MLAQQRLRVEASGSGDVFGRISGDALRVQSQPIASVSDPAIMYSAFV